MSLCCPGIGFNQTALGQCLDQLTAILGRGMDAGHRLVQRCCAGCGRTCEVLSSWRLTFQGIFRSSQTHGGRIDAESSDFHLSANTADLLQCNADAGQLIDQPLPAGRRGMRTSARISLVSMLVVM